MGMLLVTDDFFPIPIGCKRHSRDEMAGFTRRNQGRLETPHHDLDSRRARSSVAWRPYIKQDISFGQSYAKIGELGKVWFLD